MSTGRTLITQTADHTDVRATNLAVVLGYLRREAPCSRAAIAAGTGLNKATVSSLVADLIERRLVRETQQTQNHVGRPATLLVLDGSAYAAIGLEVGARGLTAIACDLGRRADCCAGAAPDPGVDAGPAKTVAAVVALARRAIATVQSAGRQVLGLTVGVPGLVNATAPSYSPPDWAGATYRLRAELAEALGRPDFPVTVDNDANLGALAEHRYGPYAGTPNLIQLTGDTGRRRRASSADGRPLRGALGLRRRDRAPAPGRRTARCAAAAAAAASRRSPGCRRSWSTVDGSIDDDPQAPARDS